MSKELEKKEKENAKLKTNVDKFQGQVDQISKVCWPLFNKNPPKSLVDGRVVGSGESET